MNWWICSECNFIIQAELPPKICSQCLKECQFSDVTCYIPECGGPNNLDSRLVALKAAEAKSKN